MSDIHPDDLLDRARAGTLDEAARARLDAHLEECRACAIEARFAQDFAGLGAATAEDDRILDRAIEAAVRALPKPKPRWGVRIAVALAAVMIFAFAWAASREPKVAPAPVASVSAPIALPPVVSSVVASSAPVPAPSAIAPAPSESVKIALASAAELFARANDARRKGANEDALRLYRELQKTHPASAEALTSRVTLGRLFLDRMSDAANARKEFAAYLATAPGGTLDEEARVGLALSAAKLGDAGAERSAWQELLAKHPESVQADRAKKRLAELGP